MAPGAWGATVQLVEDSISAERSAAGVTFFFPVENPNSDSLTARCTLSVTDLKGKYIAEKSSRSKVEPGSSRIQVSMILPLDPTKPADEVGYVVSYSIAVGKTQLDGAKSLFYLLPKASVSARLPDKFFAGSTARIPVVVSDPLHGTAVTGAEVSLEASMGKGKPRLASATTGAGGAALLEVPLAAKGALKLKIAGDAGGSASVLETETQVVEDTRVFLSTDKPLYQPGQTIHIRALILSRPDLEPASKLDALVEVFDAKGNKVFKQSGRTNKFGVTSAAFTLANQVNLGKYNILVTAGDNQTEKAVTVDRYVLPKFKVGVELDRDWYLPDMDLEGTIHAGYFFGKPVSGAGVKVTIFDYQAEWVPTRVIETTADEGGVAHFKWKIPSKLVGQPVEGGNALLLVEVEVTDKGGQVFKEVRQAIVAREPMQVAMFPESGQVVPGVENVFFLAAADPGGAPVPADCEVTFYGSPGGSQTGRVKVDSSGLARVRYSAPDSLTQVTANVEAESSSGKRVSRSFAFEAAGVDAKVLLRTGRSLLKVGDSLDIDVITSGAVSDAYLDVTRDNQTVAVATVRLNAGLGTYRLDLDPSLAGTLAVSAWVLSERGEYTRDTRVVFVQSASDLSVDVKLDRGQYKPGETAKLDFSVKAPGGQPVAAALGIHVVDEAVFALSESRPGLLKLFFALEKELLEPSYQIGKGFGLTLGSLILGSSGQEEPAGAQDQAEAAIAANGDVVLPRHSVTSWTQDRDDARGKLDEYGAWLRESLVKALQADTNCSNYDYRLSGKKIPKKFDFDAWNRSFNRTISDYDITFSSAGPDGQLSTWDDVTVNIQYYDVCEAQFKGAKRGAWARDDMVPMAMPGMAGAMKFEEAEREMPMAETAAMKPTETATSSDTGKEGGGGGEEVRVRKWFPETLFVENCLITDSNGAASIEIPLADSITTWRMSTVASDGKGRIGGATNPVTVFQDFFVDIDFPVFLTRNDRIEFPVVVYNYLETPQEVSIELQAGEWFESQGKREAKLSLSPGQVSSVRFPVLVKKVGWHALTVVGRGSAGFSDAVQRIVQVRPDGQEVLASHSGRFKTDDEKGAVALDLDYPRDTIEGSPQVVVQVLPGLTSHVVQGMESMLRLPGG